MFPRHRPRVLRTVVMMMRNPRHQLRVLRRNRLRCYRDPKADSSGLPTSTRFLRWLSYAMTIDGAAKPADATWVQFVGRVRKNCRTRSCALCPARSIPLPYIRERTVALHRVSAHQDSPVAGAIVDQRKGIARRRVGPVTTAFVQLVPSHSHVSTTGVPSPRRPLTNTTLLRALS